MFNLQSSPLWLVSLLLVYLKLVQRSKNKAKLPPGPPGIPLLGNLFQLPTNTPWLQFMEWNKQFGTIVHINLVGQHVVILGDAKTAADLLDRRATSYSDRARSIVTDILSGGLMLPFVQYNNQWKRMWRGYHEALSKNTAKIYHTFQESESVLLLSQPLETPAEFDNHLRRANNSLILSMLYGQPPITSSSNPTIQKVNLFTRHLGKSAQPGEYYVEFFTWMRFLPRWMCKWRRDNEEWHADVKELADDLVKGVENQMDQGIQKPCFTSALLDENQHQFTKLEITWMSITLYAGGSETSSTEMSWFILAMVLFPSVQQKAHEEIDRVVGKERLPTFDDYGSLPYVKALVQETLRWRPAAPLGVPHRLCKDDWYNGYFIPKDTLCIANLWEINRDPSIYGTDADDFDPGRHIDSKSGELISIVDGKDENHLSYGFGRRTCVGRHVANNSLFIQMARILWAFEINPVTSESGEIVLPDPMKFDEKGLSVRPKDFKCNLSPRFEGVEKIVDYTMEVLGLRNTLHLSK